MNRDFLDLLARFPAMLAAFESLPDYDQRAFYEAFSEGSRRDENASFFDSVLKSDSLTSAT